MSFANVVRSAVVLAGLGCGAACTEAGSDGAGSIPDGWVGQWNGPEGTYLRLEGGAGRYVITLANLDGPSVYLGTAVDGEVVFERNGMRETLRATNGAGTGMKWLADKTDCLTIRYGEGFCRD